MSHEALVQNQQEPSFKQIITVRGEQQKKGRSKELDGVIPSELPSLFAQQSNAVKNHTNL